MVLLLYLELLLTQHPLTVLWHGEGQAKAAQAARPANVSRAELTNIAHHDDLSSARCERVEEDE